MKNKRLLAMLAMTLTLSGVMTACGFGGDKPEEVVTATPTPAPTATAYACADNRAGRTEHEMDV